MYKLRQSCFRGAVGRAGTTTVAATTTDDGRFGLVLFCFVFFFPFRVVSFFIALARAEQQQQLPPRVLSVFFFSFLLLLSSSSLRMSLVTWVGSLDRRLASLTFIPFISLSAWLPLSSTFYFLPSSSLPSIRFTFLLLLKKGRRKRRRRRRRRRGGVAPSSALACNPTKSSLFP